MCKIRYFVLVLVISLVWLSPTVHAKTSSIVRDYNRKVTAEEKGKMEYLFACMAYDDLGVLWKNRAKMKSIGEEIDHVHPFRFIETACGSEKAKASVKGIYDRILLGSWVWKEFVDGCVRSLKEEQLKNNVVQFIPSFAKKVQVDAKYIKPLVESEKWADLVKVVVEKTPRSTEADRYKNM